MAFVSGLEFLNGRFDPFDLKLMVGWLLMKILMNMMTFSVNSLKNMWKS